MESLQTASKESSLRASLKKLLVFLIMLQLLTSKIEVFLVVLILLQPCSYVPSKWVSGVDQSMRSGCRLPFNNFKRKRHNCYNYGMVLCDSCSSKKSLKASMAPNPNKPYRICDNCFSKLRKAFHTDDSSHSSVSRRGSINQGPNEFIDKDGMLDSRSRAQLARFSSME